MKGGDLHPGRREEDVRGKKDKRVDQNKALIKTEGKKKGGLRKGAGLYYQEKEKK